MKDNDDRVQTPRKCIRDYCLFFCENDKRRGSKRDVVECVIRKCPLHPYRTGQLKGRSGPIGEYTKRSRIARLERARSMVMTAERDARMAEEQLESKKQVVKDYEYRVIKAKNKLEERKHAVRKLELLFNDELEAGIWNSKKMEVEEEAESLAEEMEE